MIKKIKSTIQYSIIILLSLILLLTTACHQQTEKEKFKHFLQGIRHQASKIGVSKKTLNKYLTHLKAPTPKKTSKTIKKLHHQAQAILTLDEYFNRLIPHKKIIKARQEYIKHRYLLLQVQRQFKVQPQFIVALWGLESNFGQQTGDFNIIQSLALLAFQHHRSSFYKRQLLDALIMLNRPHVIPEQLKSAWDGGMGQAQFEPQIYLYYAVDFNHDGFKNIWTNLPDIFASIANFLHLNGWNGKETWGIKVKLPKYFSIKKAKLSNKQSVSYWQKLGVTQINGNALENKKFKTAIILPAGSKGPAYMVYPNFEVLLRWNDTTFEALSTGILANKIVSYKNDR